MHTVFLNYADIAMKKIFKIIVNHYLKDFINDKIDTELSLEKGYLELYNIKLNIDFINSKLLTVPFLIEEGNIDMLKIILPYKEDSFVIYVNNVSIYINTKNFTQHNDHNDEMKFQFNEDDDYSIKKSIDILDEWINTFIHKIKININNLNIIYKNEIKLCINSISYFDETINNNFKSGNINKCVLINGLYILLNTNNICNIENNCDNYIKIKLNQYKIISLDFFFHPIFFNFNLEKLIQLNQLLNKQDENIKEDDDIETLNVKDFSKRIERTLYKSIFSDSSDDFYDALDEEILEKKITLHCYIVEINFKLLYTEYDNYLNFIFKKCVTNYNIENIKNNFSLYIYDNNIEFFCSEKINATIINIDRDYKININTDSIVVNLDHNDFSKWNNLFPKKIPSQKENEKNTITKKILDDLDKIIGKNKVKKIIQYTFNIKTYISNISVLFKIDKNYIKLELTDINLFYIAELNIEIMSLMISINNNKHIIKSMQNKIFIGKDLQSVEILFSKMKFIIIKTTYETFFEIFESIKVNNSKNNSENKTMICLKIDEIKSIIDNNYIIDSINIEMFLTSEDIDIHIPDFSLFYLKIPIIYRRWWGGKPTIDKKINNMINCKISLRKEETYKDIIINIVIYNILLKYTVDITKYIDELEKFTQIKKNKKQNDLNNSVIIKLFVILNDISVSYVSDFDKCIGEIILNLETITFSSIIISGQKINALKINLQYLELNIINYLIDNDNKISICGWVNRQKLNWLENENYLTEHGFVNIMRCDNIEFFIKLIDPIEIDVNGGQINCFACYDSLQLFIEIISNLVDIILPKKLKRPDVICDAKTSNILDNIIDINENNKISKEDVPNLKLFDENKLKNFFIDDDYYKIDKTPIEPTVRWTPHEEKNDDGYNEDEDEDDKNLDKIEQLLFGIDSDYEEEYNELEKTYEEMQLEKNKDSESEDSDENELIKGFHESKGFHSSFWVKKSDKEFIELKEQFKSI